MRISTIAILGVFLFAPAAFAAGQDGKPTCNWGEVTSEAIHEGFDQGQHASGESTPRSGLPNIGGPVEEDQQGNLEATCEFIKANLPS